jgi:predicted amidophosphoribosyltransferase
MSSQAAPERRCIGDYRPSLGGFCSGCSRELPRVAAATPDDEARLLRLIDASHTVDAIKYVRERFGLELSQSKLLVEHMYSGGIRPLGPPCPSCGTPLRTPQAKLCANCGASRDAT